jgi:hypothetical protein
MSAGKQVRRSWMARSRSWRRRGYGATDHDPVADRGRLAVPGRPRVWRSSGPAVVCRNAGGNVVIWLLVDGENGHLRLKARGIVQGPDLDDERAGPGRAAGADGSPASGAEQAGHRPLQIAAREGRRCPLGEAEAVVRHDYEGVGIPSGEILALAAMALQLTLCGVVRNVTNLAAITAAFDGHVQSSDVCPGQMFSAQFQNTSLKRRRSISKLQRGPG